MADVTVIIPTRNRKVMLARTLHSVLGQQDVDLAVVVVDDGSSDTSETAVPGIEDARVTVLRHPRSRGVSAARNTGIDHSTSPWLAFVDDDDIWAPTKLRSQLDALASDPAAGWSSTGSVNIDACCRVSNWAAPPTEPGVGDLLLRQNMIPGGGSGVVAARDLTERVGRFDEALSNLADWDFYIRLGLHSRLAPVARPHLGYFIHVNGMAHDVHRSMQEYAYLDVKYGRERQRRGVELNRQVWLVYLAGMAYNGGHRFVGMRMHAELAGRHRRWRSLRSIGLGIVPESVRVGRSQRWSPELPQGWADEADGWLARYATGWLS